MPAMALSGRKSQLTMSPKDFVDAHAVLVDGEALRRAVHGRGVEAAILQAALVDVALRVAEDDARHRVLQHLGDRRVLELGDVGGRSAADGRRILGDRDLAAGNRRHVDGAAVDAASAGHRLAVCTGSTGAGCGAGATTCFFFGTLFFCAALGAAAFFWMTSTGGSSEAAGGAGWGGAAPPASCAMAGAAVRETRHNTHANADAKRITVTPPVVREVTDTTDFEPVRLPCELPPFAGLDPVVGSFKLSH